jgi:hypothetical protein
VSLPVNFACVRRIQSIDAVHKSRLAGAVFSKESMDFPFVDSEADILVCAYSREILAHPFYFQ